MKRESGFTLIELLIVVVIIVALAATIIPLVIQFAGRGVEGSRAAEEATVQTAVDAYMTEHNLIALTTPLVDAVIDADLDTEMRFGSVAVDDPGHPDGEFHHMVDYIRDLPTECEYDVVSSGLVTQQVEAENTCAP